MRELVKEIKQLYLRYPKMGAASLLLRFSHIGSRPYRLCRDYWSARGAEPYQYGETPLLTLETIAQLAGWGREDRLLDLGCGRGITAFYLRLATGARVRGVEVIPQLIRTARRVARTLSLSDLEFYQHDIMQCDYQWATGLYLYGTCFDEEWIASWSRCVERLPRGAVIATVSWEVTSPLFRKKAERLLPFGWGRSRVIISERL